MIDTCLNKSNLANFIFFSFQKQVHEGLINYIIKSFNVFLDLVVFRNTQFTECTVTWFWNVKGWGIYSPSYWDLTELKKSQLLGEKRHCACVSYDPQSIFYKHGGLQWGIVTSTPQICMNVFFESCINIFFEYTLKLRIVVWIF